VVPPNPIYEHTVDDNLIIPNIPLTYSLGQVQIQAEPPYVGYTISYIRLRSQENTFGIDNMAIMDVNHDGLHRIPRSFDIILREINEVEPGGDTVVYDMDILEIVDSLKIVCNWLGESNLAPPIDVPMICDPTGGNWKVKVNATEKEGKAYPFGILAATRYEPLIDCYIRQDDIWFYPQKRDSGDVILIVAAVQCGDRFEEPVELVWLKCYLGDPELKDDIDGYKWGKRLEPGGADTVFFEFDTHRCKGVDPCRVYVVVDPFNELEEYDEENNIACKEVTFQE
jgi:hypothetical protein